MKRKEFQELKSRPHQELEQTLMGLRDKLWKQREDLTRGKVKNIKEVKATKRDIARILTVLNAPQSSK